MGKTVQIRARGIRTTVAALAAAAAVAAVAVPAAAATAPAAATPRFLKPAELPPHPTSPWYAGPVTAGQPDPLPLCVGEALPSIASHRSYGTEFDTNAQQITVVERTEQRAKDFAALLREDITGCAKKLMEQDPDLTATQKSYGRLNVEEGAHVYGLHTASAWGSSDIGLFSVGRDGRTVTVVLWGQMGNFQHAQVADFKKTTVTAVNKLY
ncbi:MULTISPECIES: hypothetical protein [Streptomyces]|uniref:PknH-like extracellular domain-containing protein n=1 Tax=Streptomyces koelreuteriae TaxID=2838015 RepID=A0ABX8FMU8_9ACTN|nr:MULTISPECIES: hypothetical protein [Streptomyces]QWB22483.1 hypothetical protein KJK29_07780 [Streptomyces koelreuteriae]UUA05429.1 hypothetical protein NNW98_07820 [Streptomyces koelreuteriae]UUA13055.1 hypothetical protein NNW99_07820 [Streptomyces sp. CRCS-T-1]